jgi:hypothetical protein
MVREFRSGMQGGSQDYRKWRSPRSDDPDRPDGFRRRNNSDGLGIAGGEQIPRASSLCSGKWHVVRGKSPEEEMKMGGRIAFQGQSDQTPPHWRVLW